MANVGQLFANIRADLIVLQALSTGRDDINFRFQDGVTDHDFLLKAHDRFVALIANVAADLAESFADAEDLGVMEALANAAFAMVDVEIVAGKPDLGVR